MGAARALRLRHHLDHLRKRRLGAGAVDAHIELPVPFRVPPVARSPATFSTGTGSPVSMDSSTELDLRSPCRRSAPCHRAARNTSPTLTAASSTVSVLPLFSTRNAVFGARSSRARMAPPVRSRARSSST